MTEVQEKVAKIKQLVEVDKLSIGVTANILTSRYGKGYSEITIRRICKDFSIGKRRGVVSNESLSTHVVAAIQKVGDPKCICLL